MFYILKITFGNPILGNVSNFEPTFRGHFKFLYVVILVHIKWKEFLPVLGGHFIIHPTEVSFSGAFQIFINRYIVPFLRGADCETAPLEVNPRGKVSQNVSFKIILFVKISL